MTTQQKPLLPTWARIILFIISFLFLSFLFIGVGTLVLNISVDETSDLVASSKVFMQIMQLFTLLALAIVVYVFRKYIDRKSIMSLGFSIKNRAADLGMGLFIALLVMGGGSLVLLVLGVAGFSFSGFDFGALGMSFLLFIVVALTEEIMVRGYILNNLLSVLNRYVALIISAAIFMAMHGLNSGLSVVAFINLFLAGIFLGSTYIFTQNLWFPVSLHLFWNFLQGPVFGYKVSGHTTESLFSLNLSGNDLLTGGDFGFEGSLVCTALSVVAIAVIIFYYSRKNGLSADISL